MIGLKSEKTRRCELFRKHINQVLENQGDHADDEWWEDENAREELIRLSNADEDCISDSAALQIESSEMLIIAVYKKNKDMLFEQIVKKAGSMQTDSNTAAVHLIFFVQGMRNRIQLEKSFSEKIKNQIMAACIGVKKVNCTYILVQEYTKQHIYLKNIKRYEIMHMPPISGAVNRESAEEKHTGGPRKNTLHAVVFAVDLIQLVEIYDIIGDQLFKNNVRFGINEMLGVDRAICQTLKEEPDHFWYKNNGITILAEHNDMRFKSPETILLDQIGPDKEPVFSVINGAQTITASAKYFFDLEFESENSDDDLKKKNLKEQLANSKRAAVMVKVIYVPEEDNTLANEISVALNRQKPIKIEDIAFTTPFVEKLAAYLDRGIETRQTSFRIARRGEGSSKSRQMELISFVRAVKACMGRPGEARSQGANILLKYKVTEEGDYIFQQKDVFVDQWMEAEEEQEDEVFRRFYGAAWFAQQVSSKYDEMKNQLDEKNNTDISIVIKNGKWYFTAVLVQLFNKFCRRSEDGKEVPDFSKFDGSLDEVEAQFSEGIKKFAVMMEYYVNASKKYGKLDSNFFKKNECYHDLIQIIEQVCDKDKKGQMPKDQVLVKYIQDFVSAFSKNISGSQSAAQERGLSMNDSDNQPAAAHERGVFMNNCDNQSAAEEHERSGAVYPPDTEQPGVSGSQAGGKYVVLNSKRIAVRSMAEGMYKTVEYILNYYRQVWDKLGDDSITKWLTKNQEQVNQKDGYFRNGVKQIKIGTDTYWMGTTSNIGVKKGQMKKLCTLAEVNKNEIYWYDNSDEPVFKW